MDTTPQPERQNDADFPPHILEGFATLGITKEDIERWVWESEHPEQHEAEVLKKWDLFVKEIIGPEPENAPS